MNHTNHPINTSKHTNIKHWPFQGGKKKKNTQKQKLRNLPFRPLVLQISVQKTPTISTPSAWNNIAIYCRETIHVPSSSRPPTRLRFGKQTKCHNLIPSYAYICIFICLAMDGCISILIIVKEIVHERKENHGRKKEESDLHGFFFYGYIWTVEVIQWKTGRPKEETKWKEKQNCHIRGQLQLLRNWMMAFLVVEEINVGFQWTESKTVWKHCNVATLEMCSNSTDPMSGPPSARKSRPLVYNQVHH